MDFQKAETDPRSYRFIQLKNGLQAVLADNSPPSAEEAGHGEEYVGPKTAQLRSSAALCLGVGSFSEPEDLPGLAHLTEHLVFMGSQKYPGEDTFDRFLFKHQGTNNAETFCEHMVFYFDVESSFFYKALDMFAHIFAAPSLTSSSLAREVEVVDREFQLNSSNLGTRRELLLALMATPNHPMGRFTWGNGLTLKTLPAKMGIDVQSKVQEFVQRNFSAPYMRLAVESSTNLDIMEKWISEIFAVIPNNQLPRPVPLVTTPFAAEGFYKLYYVASVAKTNQLCLMWSLPCVRRHFKTKPLQLIGWLLAYEGKNGLLAYFRKNVWALHLNAGNSETSFEHNCTNSFFSVSIMLTEKGMFHIFDIVTSILEYLELIRREFPFFRRIYSEVKNIHDNHFRLQMDPSRSSAFVERVATNLLYYGPAYCLVADELYLEYNENVIEECLNYLVPVKMNITITSSHYKDSKICDQKEHWTQTPYSVSDIPQKWRDAWRNLTVRRSFQFPKPNEYIATDFSLKVADMPFSKYPIKLVENDLCRFWYKKDDLFKQPLAYVNLHLVSPMCRNSVQNSIMTDLSMLLMTQVLNHECFDAQIAGINFAISSINTGITININGFNHKLFQFFKVIVDLLNEFEISEVNLENFKCQLAKNYYNSIINPNVLANDLRICILDSFHWSPLDKQHLVGDITMDMLLNFWQQFKSCLFIEGLIQGNITAKETIEINEYLVSKLSYFPLFPSMLPERRTTRLEEGVHICRVASFNPDDLNSVVTEYYQCGLRSDESMLDMAISPLMQLLFEQLRTREQLTYDVRCEVKSHFGIIGFLVSVTSPSDKFSMGHITERLDSFMEGFETRLVHNDKVAFLNQRAALIKLKGGREKRLKQQVSRNWHEIVTFQYNFERRKQKIDRLKHLEFEEFNKWIKGHLPFKKGFPKLSIQIVGRKDPLITNELVVSKSKDNLIEFNEILESSFKKVEYSCYRNNLPKLTYLLPLLEEKSKNVKFIRNINTFKRNMELYSECIDM